MNSDPPRRVRGSFLDELAAIALDPRVRALAFRRAGTSGLAEDALQEAFCAVALVSDPERIEDLRAYFCKALINKVYRLGSELRAAAATDPEDLALLADDRDSLLLPPGNAISAEFESELHELLHVKKLRARLQRERDQLTASVPARSHHRVRYRVAIVAAAENILSMVIEGITDKDDWTAALESEYPEWFAGPDVTGDVKALRFQSARKDARELLDALAGRENVPRQVSHSGLAGSPRAPLYLVDPPDGRFRTADDAVLGALFRKAEQALLPHEMPYNLEQGLQMFIGWLDSQAGLVRSRPRPAVTNTP